MNRVSIAITPSNSSILAKQATASAENTKLYSSETRILAQITSVSQLSDVNSEDWAFQALQSLTEKYNCIVGYPDNTYRGNITLTRSEFASALEACLNEINQLVTPKIVNLEDLTTLQRLQSEFTAELGDLRKRINNLETKNSVLEAQQFSTTTTLRGEAIFAIIAARGGEKADDRDWE